MRDLLRSLSVAIAIGLLSAAPGAAADNPHRLDRRGRGRDPVRDGGTAPGGGRGARPRRARRLRHLRRAPQARHRLVPRAGVRDRLRPRHVHGEPRRDGVGGAFGQAEARLVIARLLQTWDFELLQSRVRAHMGATLEPRPGVRMIVTRRQAGGWLKASSNLIQDHFAADEVRNDIWK